MTAVQKLLPVLLLLAGLTPRLWAYDTKVLVTGHELPKELQGVGVDEHLGANIDLDMQFTDESGKQVPLSTYFHSPQPVLMAMVYYTCPSLCNYHLNGLTEAMKTLKWSTGQDFELVAVSMNHTETPDVAGKKKHNYLELYNRHTGDAGWHFLVGNEANVKKLAAQLGFKFYWMEDKKQFAHASVAYVVTPTGKISRYLHGIQIEPNTLKLSLLEASNGKIGNMLEQAVMFCFQFDPVKNKYTLYAWNIMRIGGILMVLLLALFLLPIWWRENLFHRPRT
ncbi:MAG: SCO family protein [Bdellovibrionales bacterium]